MYRGTTAETGKAGNRALIVHGHFQEIGGAETFSLRVAGILQSRFDEVVILHAHAPPSFDYVEKRCGVHLDSGRVRFVSIPMPKLVRLLTKDRPSRHFLIQHAMVVRAAQRQADKFDFIVSTFSECPIRSERMIQTVHVPMLVSDREGLQYCGIPMSGPRRRMHAFYIWLVRRLMGASRRRLSRQFTVANSQWTADQFQRVYPGANVHALYQGVNVLYSPTSPEWIPFEERENGFAIIGRIVPAKRLETAIEIVERLRAAGHDIGLHIIGDGAKEYLAQLEQAIRLKPWVTIHTEPDRASLERLVMRQKWGLHCYQFEHYGLAPAELQALGCIAFVHDSGGQREIILNPAQRYTSVQDAVTKIDRMIRSPALREEGKSYATASFAVHRGDLLEERFNALIDEALAPAGRRLVDEA